ncbi:MAG: 23S rRNA (adenine(2030)-N(6))-methyltransferase RlmJ [Methanotrichaceae archaeon]|nr:23S rRNA (adenine(2030)-N(6))-methyltransferase RlmJ [Methanotrichaceae archaeon]
MQTQQNYDHRVHAGNAGDVWKHFVLAEVADSLLTPGQSMVYAESHAGRPEYLLDNQADCQADSQNEWRGGIGRCWRYLPALQNFCYFKILASLNPQGLRHYPGSVLLVLKAARMRSSKLHAEVWDIDSEVAAAWAASVTSVDPASRATRQDLKDIDFHQGDGFAGVKSLLDRSPPGLLLIDPPYVDAGDARLAEDLLRIASEKGWVVLWWYMLGAKTIPETGDSHIQSFSLNFADAGLDCGRWEGAVMTLAGASDWQIEHLQRQATALLRVLKRPEKSLFKDKD